MNDEASSASPHASPVARRWAAAVAVAAVALALFGGAIDGFRREVPGAPAADTPLPVCLEPQGELPEPPTVFRWQPGGDDVDISQVLLFDDRRDRMWQSAPLTGSEVSIDAARVFEGAAAGRVYSWSVREIADGRPRATSAVVTFTFLKDVQGRGIGESRRGVEIFEQ